MAHRMPKINHLIQRELSELLRREARDPRLSGMITVTEVSTAPDLSYARVFVSIMGTPEEKVQALEGLRAASVFLRRELAESLTIRRVPKLDFRKDESIERGSHMVDLIDRVMQDDNP